MSNIKYGLISETDARTLEKTIDLILGTNLNNGEAVYITEVGLYNCGTTNGIWDYCKNKGVAPIMTGIDSERDKPVENIPFHLKFIKGDSNEVYNQIPDNSQHLIFIDGCHTFPSVISDFFCYSTKVKPGAYIAFHDSGRHINPLHGWQGVGDKNDPDMCLGGVRKALKVLSLLDYSFDFRDGILYPNSYPGWELTFDEADPNDEAGGITVFKRLY